MVTREPMRVRIPVGGALVGAAARSPIVVPGAGVSVSASVGASVGSGLAHDAGGPADPAVESSRPPTDACPSSDETGGRADGRHAVAAYVEAVGSGGARSVDSAPASAGGCGTRGVQTVASTPAPMSGTPPVGAEACGALASSGGAADAGGLDAVTRALVASALAESPVDRPLPLTADDLRSLVARLPAMEAHIRATVALADAIRAGRDRRAATAEGAS